MKEVRVKLYQIDELSEKIQKSIIITKKRNISNSEWWKGQPILDLTEKQQNELLSVKGKEKLNSLSDALFVYDDFIIDLKAEYIRFFNLHITNLQVFRDMLSFKKLADLYNWTEQDIQNIWDYTEFQFSNKSKFTEINIYYLKEYTPEIQEFLENARIIFNGHIIKSFKMLRDYYSQIMTDDSILQSFRDSDTWFYANGEEYKGDE